MGVGHALHKPAVLPLPEQQLIQLHFKFQRNKPLVIFQNPGQQNLQVQANTNQPNGNNPTIHDLWGSVMLKQKAKSGSQQIEVADLAAGKYLVRLAVANGKVYSQQFVKK